MRKPSVAEDRVVRRAGLSLVPLAAIVVAGAAGVLLVLTLPRSGPPSADAVTTAVAQQWVVAAAFLVAAAVWMSTLRPRSGRFVAIGMSGLLTAMGWRVALLLDTAWADACRFGTGSGDRCISGSEAAPGWVTLSWPVLGLFIGALCAVVAAVARHVDSA